MLKEALQHKKKHKKKGKALDLQQRQEYHGSAVHWSPRKLREARAREAVRERDEMEEKLQKAQANDELYGRGVHVVLGVVRGVVFATVQSRSILRWKQANPKQAR
jgi:hypothetical protein